MRFQCSDCKSLNHNEKCDICGSTNNIRLRIAFCKQCQTPIIESDISTCPLCGSKTNGYYSDVTPVFLEEKIMLSRLLGKELPYLPVWYLSNSYFMVGNKKVKLSLKNIVSDNNQYLIIDKLRRQIDYDQAINVEEEQVEKLIKANSYRFNAIEYDAHCLVKKLISENMDRIPIVSFSGGKDSTVVSDIVRQATGQNNIIHVFCDTTLENSYTYDYINAFKKINCLVPVLKVRANKKFMDLCEEFGPPTRIRSWCCSIFKSAPISQLLNSISYSPENNQSREFLTFYGIRAVESNTRKGYGQVSDSPKITSQKVVSPIFGWLDFDVWLYILSRKINYNHAYRLGYRRVGCWCCPNNSGWSEYLNGIYFPEETSNWNSFLYKFAKKIGKSDYHEYVDGGYWKARYGGAGLDNSQTKIQSTQCQDNKYENFILSRPFSLEFENYFKPFGNTDFECLGTKIYLNVYKGKSKKKLFQIETQKNSRIIKLQINENKNKLLLRQRIECQLRKYQICIQCAACDSICKQGAIKTTEGHYHVDAERCVHCMDCIASKHLGGCLINEILQQ